LLEINLVGSIENENVICPLFERGGAAKRRRGVLNARM